LETEIGWHTKKTMWNQGFATEAASAARAVAFSRFGLSRLVAIIHPNHIASRRVAEHVGMLTERGIVLDGYSALLYSTRTSQPSSPTDLGSPSTRMG
jgi:RimJ/RimL family protein N-acetyltransferase